MPAPDNHGGPLTALIIGAGFGGLGMGVALRNAGIEDFAILEKSGDVGGVWRDNHYPGAACDVPSHLYSFSFEPNPRWSRVFAPQREILEYLRHCARKHDLLRHVRLHCEVAAAAYDEALGTWHVTLSDGSTVSCRILVSAVGQLSRPMLPALPGIESFTGPSFHSAQWDHTLELAGKRIAVVGTGASAIQFVPAIAPKVQTLHVFQRSPAHMMPRPDRAYSGIEHALFRHVPGAMKLHRTWIYLKYEARALAFTRFKGLMQLAVGRPFRRMLGQQVPDTGLRDKLTPDYPIGCKRILLSSEYLATMARPNVRLHDEGIRRVLPEGIETRDGRVHAVDAIVYGTGFAATEFLSPMRIAGRGGVELNEVWRRGAAAYLGMTVPGFPNFFMLYGPNTNLGHNSIVYMIESQIAHVMRCVKALRRSGASVVEVDAQRYRSFAQGVQADLQRTVWNGCSSWYIDANGHNSTNWPGFTVSYRWQTRFSSLQAYRLSRPQATEDSVAIAPPVGALEAAKAAFLRGFLRAAFRRLIGPPFGARFQRAVVALLSPLMPAGGGTIRYRARAGSVPVEVVSPRDGDMGAAMLYIHGGAFCLGSPQTHRSITTRLAVHSGMTVHVPDYRLAPEHPCPAALQDVLACYDELLRQGYDPRRIVLAGDSAGATLALELALAIRDRGAAISAALILISPVTQPVGETGPVPADPMLRRGWLHQALRWHGGPKARALHSLLEIDLAGLPPMLVQVGEQEILRSDSERLAVHARACGVPCRLELYQRRWHVFHLQAFYLGSAVQALQAMARFALGRVDSAAARKPSRQATPQGHSNTTTLEAQA